MSSLVAGPALVRARIRSVSVPVTAVVAVALPALLIVLAWATWSTWGDLGRDTGYDLVAGTRVAQGDLPYADFTYYYGPLAPALVGLFMWIGGVGVASAVALGLVLTAGIVLATYSLARTQVGRTGAFAAAAVTASVAFAPTNLSFVLPHTFSAPLALLATLCFVLAASRHAASQSRGTLVAAGFAAGMVGLTRPEFAAAVLFAGALWLGLRVRSKLTRLRDLWLFALPALGLPAAVYGAFLFTVSPNELLFQNLYPTEQLQSAGNAVLRIHAPLTFSSFVELAAHLGLYAAGCAALVLAARLLAGPLTGLALPATALIVAVVAAASIARPEALRTGMQYVYSWIPAGIAIALVVALVWRRRNGRGTWSVTDQAWLLIAAVLFVLSAKTYAAFIMHGPRVQPAVYAVPFAAILLARLHLVTLSRGRATAIAGTLWLAFIAAAGVGLTLKDAHAESANVHGPGGTVAATPAEARQYQGALDWIARDSSQGEAILLAPQLTALYTLAERQNPLQQLSLLPGVLPERADELEAIRRINRQGVNVIVTDRHSFDEYGHGSFGGSFDRTLARWIASQFDHVATLRGGAASTHVLDIWRRRGA